MLASARIDIEKLVEMELPPISSSAMRVATLTQDLNTSTKRIADTIGYDPTLAARLLRAANSALYAPERPITALPQAVSTLGNSSIHMLVMMYSAAEAFTGNNRRSPVEWALWEHSVAVGIGARELSQMLGMRGGEEAFLCGLLHDIGKLLLLRHDAKIYAEVNEGASEGQLLEREHAMYGYTHAQIGALVAKRWGLPEQISYVIYHHHQPSEAQQSMLMARVVDTADCLANRAGIGLRADEGERDLTTAESIIALNLTLDQLDQLWEKTQTSLEAMMHLVH